MMGLVMIRGLSIAALALWLGAFGLAAAEPLPSGLPGCAGQAMKRLCVLQILQPAGAPDQLQLLLGAPESGVKALAPSAMRLQIDGVEQPPRAATEKPAETPIDVMFVLQLGQGGEAARLFPGLQKGLAGFAERVRKLSGSRVAFLGYNDERSTFSPNAALTADSKAIGATIQQLQLRQRKRSSWYLSSALRSAVTQMRRQEVNPSRRRALIVYSDGVDADDPATTTDAFSEVVSEAAKIGLVVYALVPLPADEAAPDVVAQLAQPTGGREIRTPDAETLQRALEQLGEQVSSPTVASFQLRRPKGVTAGLTKRHSFQVASAGFEQPLKFEAEVRWPESENISSGFPYAPGGMAVLVLGGLGGLAWYGLSRRRQGSGGPQFPNKGTVAPAQPAKPPAVASPAAEKPRSGPPPLPPVRPVAKTAPPVSPSPAPWAPPKEGQSAKPSQASRGSSPPPRATSATRHRLICEVSSQQEHRLERLPFSIGNDLDHDLLVSGADGDPCGCTLKLDRKRGVVVLHPQKGVLLQGRPLTRPADLADSAEFQVGPQRFQYVERELA